MIPGKKFNPATQTSKRPTPERFAHLKKWVAPIDRSISLPSIIEMTNINQQLEQSPELFINTIVSRVFAHLIAVYGDGFVSLRGTFDGALHVQTSRESKVITSAPIDIAPGGDGTIVECEADEVINITTLVFTVGAMTNITLYNGAVAITGPMDFGGDDEPRGMVVSQGFLPYQLTAGSSFIIDSSEDVQISGYVTGYIE